MEVFGGGMGNCEKSYTLFNCSIVQLIELDSRSQYYKNILVVWNDNEKMRMTEKYDYYSVISIFPDFAIL